MKNSGEHLLKLELNRPFISVIVPSFNYASFLREALDSVLNQTFENFEIIVIDDGSRDSSLEIISEFQKKTSKLRFYQHENHQNLGLPSSLRLGLEKARGTWIAVLEADDVWSIECLEKRVEAVLSSNVDFCCNKIQAIVEKGGNKVWFDSYVPRVEKKLSQLQAKMGSFDLHQLILQENLIPTFSCAMVKKEILSRCDFETPVASWLDWFLWCQVLQETEGVFIEQPLTYWRLHSDSQNSKKIFFQFLKNYSLFRRAIIKRLSLIQCKGHKAKIAYLSQPVLFPLIFRTLKGVREIGFFPFFSQILKRIKLFD